MKLQLLVLALLQLSSTVHCQTCSDFDAEVLILGGGMTGLSAANRLAELGTTDFIILESQDRLGGRMRTEELVPGVNVNVGTSWIHGVDPAQPRLHPIWDLAVRCGGQLLETIPTDYDNIVTYYSNGTEVSEDALRYDPYSNSFEAASDALSPGDPDISIREGLTQNGWVPTSQEDNFVEWFCFDFCVAESPNVSSLRGYAGDTTYSDFLADPENEAIDWYITDNRGFSALTQCLATNFSTNPDTDDRIQLNTVVTRIEYSDECVCVMAEKDGTMSRYCAPYAIVTFSVGVLKEGATTLFSPALPQAKINALNSIVMAYYHIIYAVYDERFWNDTYEYVGHVHPDRGYFPAIQIVPAPQGVNAIAFHITEDLAYRLTSLPEENIKAEITQVFRGIYGDSVPEPSRILAFPWATDPSFRGSYSNIRVGGSELQDELRAREGRMHITGEGVSNYYGYIHGAYLSGISTANEVQARIASSGLKIASNTIMLILSVVLYSVLY